MPSMLFSPEALAYSKSNAKQSPGSCKRWTYCRLDLGTGRPHTDGQTKMHQVLRQIRGEAVSGI
jgi:hypothetical protein